MSDDERVRRDVNGAMFVGAKAKNTASSRSKSALASRSALDNEMARPRSPRMVSSSIFRCFAAGISSRLQSV